MRQAEALTLVKMTASQLSMLRSMRGERPRRYLYFCRGPLRTWHVCIGVPRCHAEVLATSMPSQMPRSRILMTMV